MLNALPKGQTTWNLRQRPNGINKPENIFQIIFEIQFLFMAISMKLYLKTSGFLMFSGGTKWDQ